MVFVGGQIVRKKGLLSVFIICTLALTACSTENVSTINESVIASYGSNNNQPAEPQIVDEDSEIKTKDSESDDIENNSQTDESVKDDNNTDNLKTEEIKSEDKKPEITIEEMSEEMYVSSGVNVREGPSVDDKKIGTLAKDKQVSVTGKSENGWYRIEYNSGEGFVNGRFLITQEAFDKKKAEEEAALIEAQEVAQKEAEQQAELEQQLETKQQEVEDGQSEMRTDDTSSFVSKVVELCNEKRAEAGLEPLTEDGTLDALALVRTGEIVGTFDHKRPDGSSCFSVLDGVDYLAAGENIASGQKTPEEVVEAWMNSEGHRANILSPDFGKIGVGYLPEGTYGTSWVQLFTN